MFVIETEMQHKNNFSMTSRSRRGEKICMFQYHYIIITILYFTSTRASSSTSLLQFFYV